MQRVDLAQQNLPDTPGVYHFLDAAGNILYIGKATALRSRVRSYFDPDIIQSRGPHIARMISEADRVSYTATDSVLEALLLEANLIKKHRPPYNTKEKDDKSFNFVVITKEPYPRILLVRGKELFNPRHRPDYEIKYAFGPFPKGNTLKQALKIIRKIFPFRDACTPCPEQTTLPCKPCFHRQIGLCPGVCSGEIGAREYQKIVNNIRLLFEGKKSRVVSSLKRAMHAHAQKREFEEAEAYKRKIFALEHIQDVALIKDEALKEPSGFRIESYDIAHTSGAARVGVMAVIENGHPEKEAYRTFNIKSFEGVNDVKALAEVIDRRLAHPEWPYPRVITVDGGKAQKNAAERVLAHAGFAIPVVSVVKDTRHRPREILGAKTLRERHEREILYANQEAHRFAVSVHRRKRGKLRG